MPQNVTTDQLYIYAYIITVHTLALATEFGLWSLTVPLTHSVPLIHLWLMAFYKMYLFTYLLTYKLVNSF